MHKNAAASFLAAVFSSLLFPHFVYTMKRYISEQSLKTTCKVNFFTLLFSIAIKILHICKKIKEKIALIF